MNLYQKLVEIRKTITYLKKDRKAFNYAYVSGTQTLSAVREKMDELGVLLVPSVLAASHADVADEKGRQDRLVCLEMAFTWVNAEKPEERLEVPWRAMGQNAREKGLGCALTYAERYFLLKFFNVPTDDLDPDAYQETYQTQEIQGSQDQQNQQKINHAGMSLRIKDQLERTGLGKDAIVAYCHANGIPQNAKDCTVDQLMAIHTHLMSQPTKGSGRAD